MDATTHAMEKAEKMAKGGGTRNSGRVKKKPSFLMHEPERPQLASARRSKKKQKAVKHTPRPRGRAPNGKVWDHIKGAWVTKRVKKKPSFLMHEPEGPQLASAHRSKKKDIKDIPRPRARAPQDKVWDSQEEKWAVSHGTSTSAGEKRKSTTTKKESVKKKSRLSSDDKKKFVEEAPDTMASLRELQKKMEKMVGNMK